MFSCKIDAVQKCILQKCISDSYPQFTYSCFSIGADKLQLSKVKNSTRENVLYNFGTNINEKTVDREGIHPTKIHPVKFENRLPIEDKG